MRRSAFISSWKKPLRIYKGEVWYRKDNPNFRVVVDSDVIIGKGKIFVEYKAERLMWFESMQSQIHKFLRDFAPCNETA